MSISSFALQNKKNKTTNICISIIYLGCPKFQVHENTTHVLTFPLFPCWDYPSFLVYTLQAQQKKTKYLCHQYLCGSSYCLYPSPHLELFLYLILIRKGPTIAKYVLPCFLSMLFWLKLLGYQFDTDLLTLIGYYIT